jgi:hypothetical protein
VAGFVTPRSFCAAIGASGGFLDLLGGPGADVVNVGQIVLSDDWGSVAVFVIARQTMFCQGKDQWQSS